MGVLDRHYERAPFYEDVNRQLRAFGYKREQQNRPVGNRFLNWFRSSPKLTYSYSAVSNGMGLLMNIGDEHRIADQLGEQAHGYLNNVECDGSVDEALEEAGQMYHFSSDIF